jgi:hypothetical protein
MTYTIYTTEIHQTDENIEWKIEEEEVRIIITSALNLCLEPTYICLFDCVTSRRQKR